MRFVPLLPDDAKTDAGDEEAARNTKVASISSSEDGEEAIWFRIRVS